MREKGHSEDILELIHPNEVEFVWKNIVVQLKLKHSRYKEKDLLMALHFMRVYDTEVCNFNCFIKLICY